MRTWKRTSLVSISFSSFWEDKTIFNNRRGREDSTTKSPAASILLFSAVIFLPTAQTQQHSQWPTPSTYHGKACTEPGANSESSLDQVIPNSDGRCSDFPQPLKEQHTRQALQQERNSPVGEGPSRAKEPERSKPWCCTLHYSHCPHSSAAAGCWRGGRAWFQPIHSPPRCIPVCWQPGPTFANIKNGLFSKRKEKLRWGDRCVLR